MEVGRGCAIWAILLSYWAVSFCLFLELSISVVAANTRPVVSFAKATQTKYAKTNSWFRSLFSIPFVHN